MRNKGFSIVETLVVAGIVATLAALLFPVFVQAKEDSKKAVCVSNLRQIYVSTTLYRSECGGEGTYGTSYAMGLPPTLHPEALPILYSLKCPDGDRRVDKTLGSGYYLLFSDPGLDGMKPSWADYAQTFQEQAILYIDPFHNPKSHSLLWGSHLSKFCQAVNLGGSLIKRRAKGDWQERLWWQP